MSRIGKMPIEVPSGVKVKIEKERVLVEGPKGTNETPIPRGIQIELSENVLVAKRENDQKSTRALHGLTRALLANSVNGASQGFEKGLDLVGIGYRAEMRGKHLHLSLGFSHPVEFPVPDGIQISVEREAKPISNYVATIKVSGASKYRVGQVAADIRSLRPPDAYKGKGIRYSDELVRTKVGKKGA